MAESKCILIILLVTSALLGCGGSKMDQAGKEAEMSSNDTLLEKADSVFNSREYEKSRGLYMEAADRAEADGDNSLLTESYAMIARTYLIVGRKEEGRPWIEKAAKIADRDEKLGWSRFLGVRGRFEWQDEKLDTATATFEEMYEYAASNKLHERAVDAAHMVAITGTPDQQVEWAKRGIVEAEAGNVTGWLGPLWNNLGATYEEMGKYQKSLDAYMKAREYHHKYGDETNKFIADWAVGHAHRLTGNLDEAENWLTETLEWCEKAEATEFIGWCHKDLGEIELARENYKPALDHFVAAEERLKAANMPNWDPDGYSRIVGQIEDLRDKVR